MLRFAIVVDVGHPLHGAVVELLMLLGRLRSVLCHVKVGAEEALLPVHQSDAVDYIWPTLKSAMPVEWPTCASLRVGTAEGTAPPTVMFTALAPLVKAVPAIRDFLAEHPQEPATALLVRLGADGVRMKPVTAAELRLRAEHVRNTFAPDDPALAKKPCLHLVVDAHTQCAYFGTRSDAIPEQLAANLWLAQRTLLARLEEGAAPRPRTACGAAGAYVFVEHEADGLVQGSAFVVPLAREVGVRVGKEAVVRGLVGRPELNGKRVTVLRSNGLAGPDDGWRHVAENPVVEVERWGAELPDGVEVLLKPANLDAC